MVSKNVKDEVISIIAETLKISKGRIACSDNLYTNLGADQEDVNEITDKVGRHFKRTLRGKYRCVQSIIDDVNE